MRQPYLIGLDRTVYHLKIMTFGHTSFIITTRKIHLRAQPRHSQRSSWTILTGRKAGKKLENGKFEKNSVNNLVNQKLLEFAIKLKEFSEEKEEEQHHNPK